MCQQSCPQPNDAGLMRSQQEFHAARPPCEEAQTQLAALDCCLILFSASVDSQLQCPAAVM